MIITPKNVLHVVLNATMRCNLRCTYCYVHSDCLSAQFDMTDDDFTSLYKWIADYSLIIGASEIHFLWFGGEPLLISESFIEKQILKQEEYLPSTITIKNIIHSNLTLITPKTIALLKKYFNCSITGSYDYGSYLRQFPNGLDARKQIENGIQTLQDNGISVEINSTINKLNADLAEQMYDFFKSHKLDFHVNMACNFGLQKPAEYFLTIPQFNKTVLRLFKLYTSDSQPGVIFRNFDSMISSYLYGNIMGCSIITNFGFELSVKSGGELYSSCPYLKILGNHKNDSPQKIYERLRELANPSQCGRSSCVENCNFYQAPCGICPSENNKNCLNSQCGYRISLNRELWNFIDEYLIKNGLSYGCLANK